MVWIAVNKDGTEVAGCHEAERLEDRWADWIYYSRKDNFTYKENVIVKLPKGRIFELLGHTMSWEDEPIILNPKSEDLPKEKVNTKTFGDLKVGDKVWVYDEKAVIEAKVTFAEKDHTNMVNIELDDTYWMRCSADVSGMTYADDEVSVSPSALVEHLKTKRNTLNSLIEEYENRSL